MSDHTPNIVTMRIKSFFSLFKLALSGQEQDYTQGSIRRAVFLLAVPMILEMCMESVFAVVDIYFVGHLGKNEAVSTVVLTESVLTIVYSLAIGLSMAATAMVARRIGEKNPEAASKAGMQSLIIAFILTVIISTTGLIFAPEILKAMGASAETIHIGTNYTRIIYGGSVVIMLLFLINGIFRGAGDASMAMRSLWIANFCNIILCPVLIYGLGPIPAFGITGAAIATTIGRGIGVLYQLYHLFSGKRSIKVRKQDFKPDWPIIKSISNIAWTGTAQFLIASASWMVLARIMAEFGDTAVAGYGVAIRLIMFFLLPAWGMSNAAATLVGQNLGAQQPQRAEQSVWRTAKYNTIFMIFVTLIFLLFAQPIVAFMNKDVTVESYAVMALRIVSLGYIFYGVGMVVTNAFNGAGDTRTPTLINIFGFWMFQVPLAFLLAMVFKLGPKGVFIAIVLAETGITIAGIILFKKGKWKKVKI
ncbi:MATE family efflux transporter [Niastella yeongjuensis]|uniref:Multidrug-efflux transporter n=1 Tax=Niastella yeongjuensis TaxID=354355 RepID=A0A1V9EWR2_9BACT|nr:MATE family efflux transporter [Niastella yeongjuensis]OQP50355.1 MATE family efflux transporter [Niastella yeongjuensis]SEN37991.1 putative efflux protein, MATE family [Niastella yeongjuensis]